MKESHATSLFGLIPAHAGSTVCVLFFCGSLPAHPRSRGEHEAGMPIPAIGEGSSPLTRGAPPNHPQQVGYPGLIPAHAGSTCGMTG